MSWADGGTIDDRGVRFGQEMRRREFLGLLGVGAVVLAAPACAPTGTASTPDRPWRPWSPLRIPEELRSDSGAFTLTVQRGAAEILPGTTTPTWGVNGPFLGPTLRMRTAQSVKVSVVNGLDGAHEHDHRRGANRPG